MNTQELLNKINAAYIAAYMNGFYQEGCKERKFWVRSSQTSWGSIYSLRLTIPFDWLANTKDLTIENCEKIEAHCDLFNCSFCYASDHPSMVAPLGSREVLLHKASFHVIRTIAPYKVELT